jgi:hypothetical protein
MKEGAPSQGAHARPKGVDQGLEVGAQNTSTRQCTEWAVGVLLRQPQSPTGLLRIRAMQPAGETHKRVR